jgi:hypothetical protein
MYAEFKHNAPDGMMNAETFCSILHQMFPRAINNNYALRMFGAFDVAARDFITFEVTGNQNATGMCGCSQDFIVTIHQMDVHATRTNTSNVIDAQVDFVMQIINPHMVGRVDARALLPYVKSVPNTHTCDR